MAKKPKAPPPPKRGEIFREAFLTEYLRNGENGAAAWRALKPHVSQKTSGVEAAKYLAIPSVSARIAELRTAAVNEIGYTRKDFLSQLKLLAGAKVTDLFNIETGEVVKGAQDKPEAAILNEIRIEQEVKMPGGGTKVTKATIKTEGCRTALMDLGRVLGYWTPKIGLTAGTGAKGEPAGLNVYLDGKMLPT